MESLGNGFVVHKDWKIDQITNLAHKSAWRSCIAILECLTLLEFA
jgi:hypothetical protein